MLVLSRHRNESIYIGDDVVITVVEIRGDKVRIGIEAPQFVAVHRHEVYQAINRRNRECAPVAIEDVDVMANINKQESEVSE